MSRKYVIGIDGSGISEAIAGVETFEREIREKANTLCRRLAELGLRVAKATFSTARYDGINDVTVEIQERGENCFAVVATGEATLFIEFGSGVTLGYGHPTAGEYGMGPGTYPDGKGHWANPGGWYIPKDKGGGHTFGNPPSGAMYSAVRELELEFTRIAKEVFQVD